MRASLLLFLMAILPVTVFAQVEYGGEPIVDSDLDGLTDRGEAEIFSTDPAKMDSDGDGWADGAEVVAEMDPLDDDSFSLLNSAKKETPWAWYGARASGIVAFLFLWLTMFFGLSVRSPITKRLVSGIYKLSLHASLAVMALLWVLAHTMFILFDTFLGFSISDVFVPFVAAHPLVSSFHLALGIISLYAMITLVVTGILRNKIPYKVFRTLHFLNVVVFIGVFFHTSQLGTDMQMSWIGKTFTVMNGILAILFLSSLVPMLRTFRASSKQPSPSVHTAYRFK